MKHDFNSTHPVIFGIDGLDDALEAVRLGTMQGTVYNDREAQARKICDVINSVI